MPQSRRRLSALIKGLRRKLAPPRNNGLVNAKIFPREPISMPAPMTDGGVSLSRARLQFFLSAGSAELD